MTEVIKVETRKARKTHSCAACDDPILAGNTYKRYLLRTDGGGLDYTCEHTVCPQEMLDAYHDEMGYEDDVDVWEL